MNVHRKHNIVTATDAGQRLPANFARPASILLVAALLFLHPQSLQARGSSSSRTDVYIAGFFPYGDGVENAQTGRGVMPSVKLALDHVNEHTTILANYRLHMWWNDTECNAAVGVKSFFDMMHSGPHKLMLFGAACTHVTDPIAKASKHWHLTQLSYADTHPMFTRDAFPNFFRVVPSENAFNAPRLAMLREFNWTRIGTIYQNEPRYSLPHNQLVADLDALGATVLETQSFVTDVRESLRKLVEKDVRIILGNFDEHYARKVFCEAYRQKMYGRSYQWLIMGTYSEQWWNRTERGRVGEMGPVEDGECVPEELATALESTIMTDLLPLSTSNEITVSGITPDEYLTEYNSRRGDEYSRFHGYTYDGIWAAALAIQYVVDQKGNFVSGFEYRVQDWENIFLEALRNTSFEGVTGPVRFYNNERRANILLKQFQHGAEVKIAEYIALQDRLDWNKGGAIKWNGRAPPKDRTLRIIEHTQVNLTIYTILASLSVVGIIMATVFLIFNIRFRNQRYIKMSSPHLNNLIIVGCMLTYSSVIFLGLDSGLSSIEAFPYICTARAWALMAGFSLAFGAMFSKTWRVHSIFTDVKLNKKVIKDYQLFIVVGALLFVDVVIMVTWQVSDPFYRDVKFIEPLADSAASMEDIIIVQENEYCQSERITIFISVIYAYKGILLIFGAFLAWETRHVSIPALNDSKHIGLSVYNVLIMCIMGAAIALVLSDHKDAVFVLIAGFIIFCTTGTLCLVFVPKLVEMRRNPQGQVDKRVRATLGPMSKRNRDSSVSELEQRMRDVKSTNCRFRKTLMEKETELQALIRKIGADSLKWIGDGIGCEGDPLIGGGGGSGGGGGGVGGVNKLTVPLSRREAISTTEITELTSVDSVTSTHADHDGGGTIVTDSRCANAQMCDTTVTQPLLKISTISTATTTHSTNGGTKRAPQQQQQQQLLQQAAAVVAAAEASAFDGGAMVAARRVSRPAVLDGLQAVTATVGGECPPPLPAKERKADNHYIKNKAMQSPTAGKNRQDIEGHTTMHRKGSGGVGGVLIAAAMHHSNSELNSLCPHTKGSTKNLSHHAEVQRRVSVGAALKGNFVVSQSDLWDTQTLQQNKQRMSPARHYAQSSQSRCSEHSSSGGGGGGGSGHHSAGGPAGSTPYTSPDPGAGSSLSSPHASAPIQRSVSEKNRPKHRHRSGTRQLLEHSETDTERERERAAQAGTGTLQREQPTQGVAMHGPVAANGAAVTASGGGQAHGSSRKLFKTLHQHAHHQSTPNVAPADGAERGGGGRHRRHNRSAKEHKDGGATPAHEHKKRGGGGGGHCDGGATTATEADRMMAARSESELLDGEEMLPIFRRLLTDKQPLRYRSGASAAGGGNGRHNGVGTSCPNISIKCDLLEYL